MRLESRRLRFSYGGTNPIINGIDLQLEPASMAALVGPNGSGKSTLLRLLCGLLAPAEGEVLVDGRNMAAMSTKERALCIAAVFPGIYRQAGCSVRELVLMGRAAHMPFWGAASKTDEKQVDFALEATGMQALQRRLISELSSGEMQRAQIAMALAQDAPIIMLDEPTAFLDLRHQLETLTLLRELNCEHGRSILCVSHDLNLLSRFFKMLFVLESGKIYTQGNVSEVLTSRTLLDVFGVEAGIERDSAGCVRIDMTIK